MFWTAHLIDCLSLFCLVLFLEFCYFLSFGPCFILSSSWQPPCVCFFVLGRVAFSSVLVAWPIIKSTHVGWRNRALDNHQGGATHMNQVDGVSDMVSLLYGSVWGGLRKGTRATAWPLGFCLGESCPLTLTLMPDTSVSAHVPLMLFHLLPHCWSPEWVSLCKFLICCEPFKNRCLKIPQFLPNSQWFLLPEVMGTYLSVTRPWAGWSAVGLGSLDSEVSVRIFIHHMWVWDQPVSCLHISVASHLLPCYLSGWTWLPWFFDCQTSTQLDFLMIPDDNCFEV